MADKPSSIEFGKRRPAPLPEPSVGSPKRSSHVALLVMGTLAVGGGAYALMGPENCQPPPGVAAPAQAQTTCTSRWSSSSGGRGYSRSSRFSFFGGGDSSHSSSSGATESGSVSRGGFGGFAHAFGFSGRS
ncbi:MAG: hypothetical protein JO141_07520 [Bradyrhizobium sp.]|nr:hypothetical protein [Bradyrhizobium sp.]